LPVVAIIGRPNVGKSTLFNRIIRRRKAIVHDQPGVTRDRIYEQVEWNGFAFRLVDTGGFDPESTTWDGHQVALQAAKALEEAAAVIFVLDAAGGVTPLDRDLADILRRADRPVHLAANKVDHPSRMALTGELASLGFFPIHPVSAEHGVGVDDLLEAVVASLPPAGTPADRPDVPRIALVGRPNVGKSTLANRLLGEERFITHHLPGTTRDAVDSEFELGGRTYILTDTAGIRRRGKIRELVEKVGVQRATDTILRSDVCLLLVDGNELVTEGDAKVAGLIHESGRACCILVNKWDQVSGVDRAEARKAVQRAMPFMDYAPVLFVSAATGLGLHRLMPAVDELFRTYTTSVPTPELNRFLQETVNRYKPASFHGKPVTFGYMLQTQTRPPVFRILVNDPDRVHLSYRRYLVNRLRDAFGFRGIPLLVHYRRKKRKERNGTAPAAAAHPGPRGSR
jgi:GTP-binding protein